MNSDAQNKIGIKETDAIYENEFHEGYIDFLDNVCKPNQMSLEELKRYDEFKNVTNQEGIAIIETLYSLSLIAYYALKQQNKI
jgi:hypothetical protein